MKYGYLTIIAALCVMGCKNSNKNTEPDWVGDKGQVPLSPVPLSPE